MLIFLEAYFCGGVINHAMTLAIHDISHNTVFGNKYPLWNRFFGMLANLPVGVPFSASFKKYHVEHHRYLGEDGLDTDVPTDLEAQLFTTPIRKFIWLLFQPFFYAFRPLIIYKKSASDLEIINAIVQLVFDVFVLQMFGIRSFLYLIIGTFVAMGVHPSAGHFISEHYVFKEKQETYSYYGSWNLCTFNVGYHVEHHDFPYIPGRNLPQVRKIAPEFYIDLHTHSSWIKVLWHFVFSPNMGPYMRLKRKASVAQTFQTRHALAEYYEAVSENLEYPGVKFESDNPFNPLERIFQLLQFSGFNELRHYAAKWLCAIDIKKKIN
ncbi:putative sphingolipid delta(4)-desaturase/C4-monooxygenase, variant 2 [Parelaphostrongylus tenuis]|uniref:Sphingolipid delta(4)-desaturase/C4-monooxygenase, variant 2 n=1 Tax=Parelaphostrongylus tenuis TaxID=148309 RepID=A0AAD5M809_PARTN|nr:putative sphingolipid delta(4)-desaturase/C4-monooxygenase, variant 2 [Parelaphostrongylus tenuis]